MIAGSLELQITAGLSRLQGDMDKAKNVVGTSFNAMQKILGGLGVGLSVVGLSNMIKQVADAGDKLSKLSQSSGLTVEQLGSLNKMARLSGTSLDAVSKAVGLMSKNMFDGSDAFKMLNVQTRETDGSMRSANSVLLDVADRFSKMRDGVEKSAISMQVFGKSGRELIPLLNEGRAALESATESYTKNAAMTTKAAKESVIFNDNLELLADRTKELKTRFVVDLLPALNDITGAFLRATDGASKFSGAGKLLAPILRGLAIAGYTIIDTFNGVGRTIGAAIAQAVALAKFDYTRYIQISDELNRMNVESRETFEDFIQTVMHGENVIDDYNDDLERMVELKLDLNDALGKTSKANAKQQKELKWQAGNLRELEDIYNRVQSITRGVATKQEIYNDTLEELTRLKPYLGVETYARALEKAQDELEDTGETTRTVLDAMDQLWIQAGRNIQTTMANSIFDFFSSGLDDMWRNAKIAIGRILSEFAALKLAQSIGLAAMFPVLGSPAASGAGTSALGIARLGSSAMNLFKGGFGSSAMNLFKGGFGATSLLSGIGGMFPGSAGAFFGGMGGGTVAGVSSPAALAGSSFAAVAGPAIALAAVDAIGRLLAGDKKLGGAEMIPVLGGFLAAMFGRGPMKFRQQVAIGEASGSGFDGRITDVFRAKGGAFVGNKHKEQAAANAAELLALFSTAIKGYADASRVFAKNLGLDADVISNYSKTIRLESEKGKTLTEEAIREMLSGIGNELAESVLPIIGTLKKTGEDSMATLSRLNSEFLGLAQGAENLGASAGYAKELILGMSFEVRTAFVEEAGGLEALANKTAFFAQNFLTDAERMAPAQERLSDALTEMGLSASLTRDEFKNLVQTNDELRLGLLELAPAFVLVTNYTDALAKYAQDTADALAKSAQDTADADLAKALANNNARRVLEIELMELQGKTQDALTARRHDELMVIDKSLVTLQQAIFRQQDINRAAEEASAAAEEASAAALARAEALNAQNLKAVDTAKFALAAIFDNIDLAFSALGRSVEADKNKILASNAEIELQRDSINERHKQDLESQNDIVKQFADSINDLEGFSKSLKNSIESISTMSLEAARSQIESAIKTGNLNIENVSRAVDALSKTEASEFASAIEFKRAQAKNVQLLNELSGSADAQITLEQRTLSALESARDRLVDSYNAEISLLDEQVKSNQAEISRLDQILIEEKTQIDILRGIDVSIISITQALGNLRSASAAVGGGQAAVAAAQAIAEIIPRVGVAPEISVPLLQNAPLNISAAANTPFQGPLQTPPRPLNVTIGEIRRFALRNTPMETYQAAIRHGVSSAMIASTGVYTQTQIDKFVRDNNLASFDVGGRVPRTGLAMIHKDEQVLTADEAGGIDAKLEAINNAIKNLTETVEVLTVTSNKSKKIFESWDGRGMPATRAV